MGNLSEERINPNSKPFTDICLDLLDPTMVKVMTNKRAHMKVWPILFVCQATGALHVQVAQDYVMKDPSFNPVERGEGYRVTAGKPRAHQVTLTSLSGG